MHTMALHNFRFKLIAGIDQIHILKMFALLDKA